MGLITGLLTLPLAPVRGTVWLAQVIEAKAEELAEMDEPSILQALEELEAARVTGELSAEEIEQAEDELVERLMELRGVGERESFG